MVQREPNLPSGEITCKILLKKKRRQQVLRSSRAMQHRLVLLQVLSESPVCFNRSILLVFPRSLARRMLNKALVQSLLIQSGAL